MPDCSFHKCERLCGKMRIQALYKEGKRFVVWPLRVSYMPTPEAATTQVLIWAPKSLFKHATDRNRLRRMMREAYRTQKDLLPADKHYQIAFHYMDKTEQPMPVIAKAMRKAFSKISTMQP